MYIAARSQEKSQKAIDDLKKETGKETVFFLKLDLADLVAVKAAAEEYMGNESELHGLYNNAYVLRVFSVVKNTTFLYCSAESCTRPSIKSQNRVTTCNSGPTF